MFSGIDMVVDSDTEYTIGELRKTANRIIEQFWQSPLHKSILASDHDFYVGIGIYHGFVCISMMSSNQDDTGYEYYWYDESGKSVMVFVKETGNGDELYYHKSSQIYRVTVKETANGIEWWYTDEFGNHRIR